MTLLYLNLRLKVEKILNIKRPLYQKKALSYLVYPLFQVSWLRHLSPIPTLLALNNLTNSPDPRYTAFHDPGSEKFVLRMRNTKLEDAGRYECQVAPGGAAGERALSWFIHLDVVGE